MNKLTETYDKKIQMVGGKIYERGNHIWRGHKQLCIEFDSDFYITFNLTAKNQSKQAQKMVDKLPELCYPSKLRDAGWNVPDECIKLEQGTIISVMGRQVGKTGMVTRRLQHAYGLT